MSVLNLPRLSEGCTKFRVHTDPARVARTDENLYLLLPGTSVDEAATSNPAHRHEARMRTVFQRKSSKPKVFRTKSLTVRLY